MGYIKPISNININGERLKQAIKLKLRANQYFPLSSYIFNVVLES